jgi:hypothetical protein
MVLIGIMTAAAAYGVSWAIESTVDASTKLCA